MKSCCKYICNRSAQFQVSSCPCRQSAKFPKTLDFNHICEADQISTNKHCIAFGKETPIYYETYILQCCILSLADFKLDWFRICYLTLAWLSCGFHITSTSWISLNDKFIFVNVFLELVRLEKLCWLVCF